MSQILLLPGDGIGPEIMRQAELVLRHIDTRHKLGLAIKTGLVGGAAIDAGEGPLADSTLQMAAQSTAILLGAVGGPRWDELPVLQRPERGLLRLRSELGLFANIRPATLYPELQSVSTLKPEVISGLDIMIVRELTGGIYFGEPRGRGQNQDGATEAWNTLRYSVPEIERIAHVACKAAAGRRGKLCSVDKANALESMALWRATVSQVAEAYAEVEVSHMYVDNAAMQLVRAPKQFDVILADNMFGDILSDLASMLTGSIGMLASASLDASNRGMYEPIHGSAPDIAGSNKANPMACILSVAMLLRYSLQRPDLADAVEVAVKRALADGLRTADIASTGEVFLHTSEMGEAILARLD